MSYQLAAEPCPGLQLSHSKSPVLLPLLQPVPITTASVLAYRIGTSSVRSLQHAGFLGSSVLAVVVSHATLMLVLPQPVTLRSRHTTALMAVPSAAAAPWLPTTITRLSCAVVCTAAVVPVASGRTGIDACNTEVFSGWSMLRVAAEVLSRVRMRVTLQHQLQARRGLK